MRNPAAVRLIIAAALVVEFGGFLYDTFWHDQHLSEVAIPPGELLTVHGGIYLGQLTLMAVAATVIARRAADRPTARVLWAMLCGGLVQTLGSVLDMWSHGHGYEKDLYHNTIYAGAAVTVLAYLLLEVVGRRSARGEETRSADSGASAERAETASRVG
ncbi:hypothetical protein ACH4A8_39540 [Streptomyces vietnamensis]|uniref:hypothetical protein n=1 Tax=Streptomyces vietnamensis TaxID=362257 RepID=UPI0034167379